MCDDRHVRVLVCTTANSGHFGPLLPVARACITAGHEVVVAAPTSFADDVAAAGLQHRPFADPSPESMGAVFARVASLPFEEANELVVSDVFARLDAQAALPGLLETIEDWAPDIVVREAAEFGSLAAAESAGVPQAVVAIGTSAMTDAITPLVAAPLSELDALAGLPEGAAMVTQRTTPTLTCVPASLDGVLLPDRPAAGPLHRFRDESLVGGPGTLPQAWGDPSHPLVYASFGSVTGGLQGLAGMYPAVLSAFADQPVRVLLTTGHGIDPADLEPIPANARVERWWPQADVMPYAAVVVGHGGFGTTLTAVAAGVPQVVVPLFSLDQRINAAAVAASGAGLDLDGGPSAMGGLPEAVARLLSEASYRHAARAVAEEMAALPPLAEVVAILERVASR